MQVEVGVQHVVPGAGAHQLLHRATVDLHRAVVAGKDHDRQPGVGHLLQYFLDIKQSGLLRQVITHGRHRRDAAQAQLLQHRDEFVRIGHRQPALAQVGARVLIQRCAVIRRGFRHRLEDGCLHLTIRQPELGDQRLPGRGIGAVGTEDLVEGRAALVEELQTLAAVVVHHPGVLPVAKEQAQVDVLAQHQAHLRIDLHILELAVAFVHAPVVACQAHDPAQAAELWKDLDRRAAQRDGADTQLPGHQLALTHAQPPGAVADAQAGGFCHQRLVPGAQFIGCHVHRCLVLHSGRRLTHRLPSIQQ